MLHMTVSWSPSCIQHKQHSPLYAFRLPFMFRRVMQTSRATAEQGSGERTVRDTQHASRWPCCRTGTCSSCFGTCSLARSINVAHGGVLVAHEYSAKSTVFSVRLPITTHVRKCSENGSRYYRTSQWRAYCEMLIMQADGSVVVSKLAVVVLVLARSLTNADRKSTRLNSSHRL